jgi:hypothetical protein
LPKAAPEMQSFPRITRIDADAGGMIRANPRNPRGYDSAILLLLWAGRGRDIAARTFHDKVTPP